MSTKGKLLKRFLLVPGDFTYEELKTVLKYFGFVESNSGRTSGSRVAFVNEQDQRMIKIHKPHPRNVVGKPAIRSVIEFLKEGGYL